MAKLILITCDRCRTKLDFNNWQGNSELCNDCVLLVTAAESVARTAIITNRTQAEVLNDWLKLYEPS